MQIEKSKSPISDATYEEVHLIGARLHHLRKRFIDECNKLSYETEEPELFGNLAEIDERLERAFNLMIQSLGLIEDLRRPQTGE